MSVLVVGVSHRSANVELLERLALDADGAAKLARSATDLDHVAEAGVIATCNRVEVYADVDRFHGSVEELTRLLSQIAGGATEELVPHLYVHYDDGAVAHLFQVAAGLDSMVIGESQILGQTREALRSGQEHGTVGPALNLLFQQALRVGKRAHAETSVDRNAPSLVTAGLARVADHVGDLAGRRVLVAGAGSLAALAVATAARLGAQVVVANRTADHAARLAEDYQARAIPLADLTAELGETDVLISCTGATGTILTAAELAAALAPGRRFAVLDLALPHDVDPAVADLPDVALISLSTLAEELAGAESGEAIAGVRDIVAEETAAFLAARRSANVTPTLVALRSMATAVVDAEMDRLTQRLPGLADAERDEVRQTVRRVADKLLHQPTVRIKELAGDSAVSYASALAELFSLDPDAVEAVTRAEERR